tara:strand:+ start:8516 stop:9289 length:774 start_codon:yes stop_codon:yes gene_type:complete
MFPIILTIEGNIGAGKSTLITKLIENLRNDINSNRKIIYLQEPVDEWSKIKSKDNLNMLELFYSNSKKYAFAFQMMAFISRMAKLKQAMCNNKNSIIICERSIFTDREVFAKMLYEDGLILEEEYQIYNKWFVHFANEIKPSGIIYLKTDPNITDARIKKRNRLGENIDIQYLEKCHKYHEDWIQSYENISHLLIIDYSYSKPEDIIPVLKNYIKNINTIIENDNEKYNEFNEFDYLNLKFITFLVITGILISIILY